MLCFNVFHRKVCCVPKVYEYDGKFVHKVWGVIIRAVKTTEKIIDRDP